MNEVHRLFDMGFAEQVLEIKKQAKPNAVQLWLSDRGPSSSNQLPLIEIPE